MPEEEPTEAPLGQLLDADDPLEAFLGWVESTGKALYPAQEEAILELFEGRHVFLTTPTGSGKSLVALALHFLSMHRGERSVYTAPIKALVREKHRDLVALFGSDRVGILTGDGSHNRDAPIVCCTAEILSRIALMEREQTPFAAAILDEFHFYGDRDRGMAWQLPLLTLPHVQFLPMSATLGPTRALREDLEARTGRTAVEVGHQERPVPLTFRYHHTKIDSAVDNLLGQAPVYVVHFSQRAAAEHAQALLSTPMLSDAEKAALKQAVKGFRFDSPYGKTLRRFVLHGIGLHHAGLLPKTRALVETLAQRGLFKVICGTDTLGVGINLPIRAVLFTKLCKFDGVEVRLLTARHFHQISGRAGRKGFDDEGWVVGLAPEWIVENQRLEAAIESGAKKRKKVKKQKPPTRGYKHWDEGTFEALQAQGPEPLTPVFTVDHGVVLAQLQRAERTLEDAMEGLHGLIETSHVSGRAKAKLHTEADERLEELVAAGVVVDGGDAVPRYRVQAELHETFSLHHALSLYLLHALEQLPTEEGPPDAMQVLTMVESILEHPGPILMAQEQKARKDELARLKAAGVPYEERLEILEEISYPKPMADWIYATYNAYKETRPWLAAAPIRPKTVARAMVEQHASFSMYVKEFGMERSEGVLLRYLSTVYRTLLTGVPIAFRSEPLDDVLGYLRAMLARVDDSLVRPFEISDEAEEQPDAFWANPRALRARIRNELMSLVKALSLEDWDEAIGCVRSSEIDMRKALEPYGRVTFDARIRAGWTTQFEAETPQRWKVRQVLVDDDEDEAWSIEGTVDLSADPGGPLVEIVQIGL